MKLHILSDSHTEFSDFDPPETGADAVVLAGGIDGLIVSDELTLEHVHAALSAYSV